MDAENVTTLVVAIAAKTLESSHYDFVKEWDFIELPYISPMTLSNQASASVYATRKSKLKGAFRMQEIQHMKKNTDSHGYF